VQPDGRCAGAIVTFFPTENRNPFSRFF